MPNSTINATVNGLNSTAGNVATLDLQADGTTVATVTTSGITITGGLNGSGANLTSINASNISSGTLANARTTASSSNGASTIVARGASGEFAAGTITATFSGDGSAVTSINASNISSGTIANARTTASSSNGASTIVARDASGNFSANTITATITGTASALVTGNSYQVGSLGVGTAASGTTGEIRATNNVTAFYSSDRKFKENIKPIPNAVEIVSAIGGVMFDWTDDYLNQHGGEDGYFIQKNDFGVIAQDVLNVFPTAVRTREDGSLAVDYEKLSALAFAAIKELKDRIEKLEG